MRGLTAVFRRRTSWKLKKFAWRKEGLYIGELKYLRGCHVKDALNVFCVTARAKINNNNWKVEGSRFWLQPLSINRGSNKISFYIILISLYLTEYIYKQYLMLSWQNTTYMQWEGRELNNLWAILKYLDSNYLLQF